MNKNVFFDSQTKSKFFNYLCFDQILIILLHLVFKNLTSNLNITDIVIDDNRIYATTNGGIIIFNQEDKTLNNLGFNDDIYPLDLKSIYIDSNKNI